MSRTRTRTRTTTNPDRIQELIDALNGIDGIEFTEDAWVDKAPNNYGVVELTGEAGNDYADGIKVGQSMAIRITIYVTGGSHRWIRAVQEVLSAMKLGYTLPQREYLQDIKKVQWTWLTRIRMPQICPPEAAGNG